MEIKEVKIKNFRGYGINKNSEDGFFTFKDLNKSDLVILSGYNGFGKTSFYDAIEWCLTDKIQRLMELDDVFKQGKNNLKKSEYLQFNKTFFNNGKAEVAVTLVNENKECYIRRVTECKSLQDLKYISICYNNYGEILKQNEIYSLIGDFDKKTDIRKKLEYTVNSSILGQERINDFLRLTKPSQRKEAIFNLVGLNSVAEINKLAQSKKLNYPKKLLDDIKKTKLEYDKSKLDIEKWFKIKGFGTFDNYFVKAEADIKYINKNLRQLNISEDNFEIENNINCDEIIDTIDNYIRFNNIVDKDEIEKNYQLKNLYKTWYINRLNYTNIRLDKIKFLSKFNKKLVEEKIKENKEKVEFHSKSIVQIEQIEKNIVVFNNIADNSKYTIIYNQEKLKNIEIEELEELLDNIEDFYAEFEIYSNRGILKYKNKLDKFVLDKIKSINIEIEKNISLSSKINEKKELLSKINQNNDIYGKILGQVKGIIIEKKLQQCPVCKNNKFDLIIKNVEILKQEKSSQLLHIINETLAQGSKEIYNLQKLLSDDEKDLKIQKDNLLKDINYIKTIISNMYKFFSEDYEALKKYIDKQHKCINKRKEIFNNELQSFTEQLEMFSSKLVDIRKDFKISGMTLNNELDKVKKSYINLRTFYIKVLQDKYGLIDVSNNQIMELVKDDITAIEIQSLLNRLNINKKIKESFKNLEIYHMSDDEKEKYKSYVKFKMKINKIEELSEKLDRNINNYSSIIYNMKNIEEDLMKKLVNDDSLAIWIFKQINPHPLYNSFKFKVDETGTNIVSEENENIFLDHIFSSAQLNVLALSIFLGFCLTRKDNELNQIFLDDPIQNMDDYNILSVIDIFRSITNNKINKTMVISTHDENFKKLLVVKFRNKRCKIFDFVGYDDMGPIIKDLQ